MARSSSREHRPCGRDGLGHAVFAALAAAQEVWHAFEVAWIETTAFLSKTWTNFTSDLKDAWHLAQNWLTKRWIDLYDAWGQQEQAADCRAKLPTTQPTAPATQETPSGDE